MLIPMQEYEAKVSHKIIGERHITEREFFSGEAKFTATWEAGGVLATAKSNDISVHVQVNSPDDNEMIEIVLDQDAAERLLKTLERFKKNNWKF